MTKQKRLQIGLMIHHLENEYASEILKGAIAAAEELDINLILLPGRGINAVEDDEKYSIYDLSVQCDLQLCFHRQPGRTAGLCGNGRLVYQPGQKCTSSCIPTIRCRC